MFSSAFFKNSVLITSFFEMIYNTCNLKIKLCDQKQGLISEKENDFFMQEKISLFSVLIAELFQSSNSFWRTGNLELSEASIFWIRVLWGGTNQMVPKKDESFYGSTNSGWIFSDRTVCGMTNVSKCPNLRMHNSI